MPYISKQARECTDRHLTQLIWRGTSITPGFLNYVISKAIHLYVKYKGLNQTHLNDVIGVLDSAKQEFYRTVVAPYEDKKRKENGSVSELDKVETDGKGV